MEKRLQNIPYLLVILFTVLVTSFACSDKVFEEQAGDRITPDKHYKSLVDVQISMAGAMIPLQDIAPRLIMVDGLRSDMMDVTDRADAYFNELNMHSISLSNPFVDPSDLYKVIINVNEILLNIDDAAEIDKRNLDSLTLHYVKGGLVGLRSWIYLTIVRMYGEAAYYADNNLTSLPDGLNQVIFTKEVMIDTLINQLLPYIQNTEVGKQYPELYIPRYMNTKALLGELYLERGLGDDYLNAAVYLKMACESYGNRGTSLKVDKTNRNESWKNIFTGSSVDVNLIIGNDVRLTENISVVTYETTEGQNNPLPRWMLYSEQYMVKPSQVLIDSFKTQIQVKDVVGDLWRGVGFTYDTTDAAEPFITKYALIDGEPYSSDIILSRASDINLLLAEALNRSGDPTSAMVLLNDGFNALKTKPPAYTKWGSNIGIRGRVYLKNRPIPVGLGAEELTELVEDFILSERAMELAFEGKRFSDLVRVAKRRANPGDYLASKVAAKFGGPGNSKYDQVYAILSDQANWYLPYKK